MFLWLLAGTASIVAIAALIKARHLAKRLERLTESYWELRYEQTQLRARVGRIDPDDVGGRAEPPPLAGVSAFVPLSSLRGVGSTAKPE